MLDADKMDLLSLVISRVVQARSARERENEEMLAERSICDSCRIVVRPDRHLGTLDQPCELRGAVFTNDLWTREFRKDHFHGVAAHISLRGVRVWGNHMRMAQITAKMTF